MTAHKTILKHWPLNVLQYQVRI